MKRLFPKFWAFLRYLQKEQGALLTMADNLYLLAPGSPPEPNRIKIYYITCRS